MRAYIALRADCALEKRNTDDLKILLDILVFILIFFFFHFKYGVLFRGLEIDLLEEPSWSAVIIIRDAWLLV